MGILHSARTALAVLLLLSLSADAQVGSHDPRFQPFGVQLNPGTLLLWQTIEEGYGKPIRQETMPFTTSYGFSDIAEDGTPFLRLAKEGMYEENIAHELLHLKLRLEGFPVGIRWNYHCKSELPVTAWVASNLRDPVEHWLFYPQVISLGLTPDPELSQALQRAIKQDGFVAGSNLSTEDLADFYFRALTIPAHEELKSQLKRWYERKGWNQAIALGTQMYSTLLLARPRTPDQEMAAFIALANILYRGTYTFRLTGWTTVRRGSHSFRSVGIDLSQTAPCDDT